MKFYLSDSSHQILSALHPDIKRKIRNGLRAIAEDPHVGKSLVDELDGYRSYRVGRFRIVYRVSSHEIEIVMIGPRSTIYEETYRLLHGVH